MSRLRSFSFRIQPARKEIPAKGFFIPNAMIHEIVQSLPTSVQHLELDTKCCDKWSSDDASMNVCTAISDRFNTLINLRLRLHRICPGLLKPSSTLRTPVISLVNNGGWTTAFECPTTQEHQQGTNPIQQAIVGKATRVNLVNALKSKIESLSSLERCILLDGEHPEDSPLGVHALHVRDFLKMKQRYIRSFGFP